ncbi:uncharacterized protein LOC114174508 [Vigna unguiculata]|uniref:Aminotransferase-like n=1 Tax=Vigna unguiculata TaxID=3917 RepID=A0A4D6LNQ6_VIGUN|nr:uncharacterized protein LOC114174508 [Vigna unguiculata]QCD90005.1 Aminotransferase-like [Vigna unguiculata]
MASKEHNGGLLIEDVKMFFRHSCKAKYVGSLNEKLSVKQRELIARTPFWWFMSLNHSVKISRNLLPVLCYRWVERRGGFAIGREVVEFNLLDVCLGLGLRVLGEKIDISDDDEDSDCRKLFSSGKVHVKRIYEFLLEYDNDGGSIELFTSLYILLGIYEFLLPNRDEIVFPKIFKLVDDLQSIGKYNWGNLVYDYLVGSLCSASRALKYESNTSHIHLFGCVYMLQLWSFDHIFVCNATFNCDKSKFPRLLHWMNIKVGDKLVKSSFDKELAINEVVVCNEELGYEFVREAFQTFGTSYNRSIDKENEELKHLVENEEREIAELEAVLSHLEDMVAKKEEHNRTEGDGKDDPHDDGNDEEEGDVGVHYTVNDPASDVEGDDSAADDVDVGQQSNMYDRMKSQPRKRIKSRAIRMPFAGFGSRRKTKLLTLG